MAESNLNYVISILKGDLKGMNDVLAQLGELRRVAELGAQFDIELNPASVDAMRKQVNDALGSAITVDVSAKGGGKGMDAQTAQKLDTLINRIERVATALEQGHGAPSPHGDAVPPVETALSSVKAAARSFRESMATELQKSSLGSNVQVVTARQEIAELRRAEQKGKKSDQMANKATQEGQVLSAIQNRQALRQLLDQATKSLYEVSRELSGAERELVDRVSSRIRDVQADANKIDFSNTPKGNPREKARDWAKNVISVFTEIDRALEAVTRDPLGRRPITGPGSRTALTGSPSQTPFNERMMAASLQAALEASAPVLGRSIGAAVGEVLQTLDFSRGGSNGGSTKGDYRRPESWTQASGLTEAERARVARNLKGNDLAKAVVEEREAEMALQQASEGYFTRKSAINRRLQDLERLIGDDRQTLSILGSDPEFANAAPTIARRQVVQTALAEKFVEQQRLFTERKQLEDTDGDRYEKARLEYESRRYARELLEQEGRTARMGYGSALDQQTVWSNPESVAAMTLRQVDNYLQSVEARGGGGFNGAQRRNAAIMAASSGYMAIDPLQLQKLGYYGNRGMSKEQQSLSNRIGALQLEEGTLLDELDANSVFGQIMSPQERKNAETKLATVRKELTEARQKFNDAFLVTLQRDLRASLEAIANLPLEMLGPDKTQAQQEAIVRNLREQLERQKVGELDPRNKDFTGTFGVLRAQAYGYLDPILRDLYGKAKGGASFDDVAPIIRELRQIPLVAPFLPPDTDLQKNGLGGLAKNIEQLGVALKPSYNLTNIQAGTFRRAAQPLMPDDLLPAERDEWGNPYRLPLSPLTIGRLPAERQSEMTQLLSEYMSGTGMRFAVQSERRRGANERWMKTLSSMINSIEGGELPSYVPLGDVKGSMVADEVTFRRQLDALLKGDFLGGLTPEQMQRLSAASANVPKVKINKDGYQDVLAQLRTAFGLAVQENLAGGVFYDPSDEWTRQRVYNGMLVTTGRYRGRTTRGEYDPATGRALGDIKPFDASLGMGANQAEVLAAEAALLKMNDAVGKLVDGLTKLTGAADPLTKALEPIAQVADKIASAMGRVEQTMSKLGMTKGGASSRGLGAIATAEAKKDIAIAKQRELREDREMAALRKEQEQRIERALMMQNAEEILARSPSTSRMEYRNLFVQDRRQYLDLLRRANSASATNRFRQEQIAFDLQGAPVGGAAALRLTETLASAQRTGYARNQQMVMAALGANPSAELQNPLRALQNNLAQLLPATRAFDAMQALKQAEVDAQQQMQDAEASLQQFEKLRFRYTRNTEAAKALQNNVAREREIKNKQRDNFLALRNVRRAEDLPSMEAVEQGLRAAMPVPSPITGVPESTVPVDVAIKWLGNALYNPRSAVDRKGQSMSEEQFTRWLQKKLVGKDGNIDIAYAQSLVADEAKARAAQGGQLESERRFLARDLRNIQQDQRAMLTPGESPETALARLQQQEQNLASALKRVGQVQDLGGLDDASEQKKQKFFASRRTLQEVQQQYQAAVARAAEILKSPGKSEKELAAALKELTDAYRKLAPEAAKAAKAVEETLRAEDKTKKGGLETLTDRIRSISQYAIAGGLVYTLQAQVRRAIATAVETEYEARRIQGTLATKSGVEAEDILTGAYGAAMDTGTDVRKALELSRVFAQTGESSQKVQEMTRSALNAQVGAGLEGTQAAEFLIAVENVTKGQIAPSDIIDRISRIESQYAVSARDLSVAIQRAGSLAQQLQPQANGAVSALDLVIGSATAIIERTRVSGEQASTSLRFIYSRLLQPDVGRELQTRFGIRLGGEQPGSLRPLQDILADISQRYNELNATGRTAEASSLLVTFAGARQANPAAALLEDFGKAVNVAKEASQAYGDTQQRVALQLDTISAQYQRLQTGLSSLATTVFTNSPIGRAVKGGYGLLADFTEYVSSDGEESTAASILTPFGVGAAGAAGAFGARALTGAASRLGLAGTAAVLPFAAEGLAIVAAIAGAVTVLQSILAIVEGIRNDGKEDVKTFDQKQFRESDFYKGFAAQTEKLGLRPEQVTAALAQASRTVNDELRAKYGAAVDDPQSKMAAKIRADAETKFVEALISTIPALKEVGKGLSADAQRREQINLVTSLLNTGIKFENAPVSDALQNFRTRTTDAMTTSMKSLSAAITAAEDQFRAGKSPGGINLQRKAINLLEPLADSMAPMVGELSGAQLLPNFIIGKDKRYFSFDDVIKQKQKEGASWQDTYTTLNQLAADNLVLPEQGKYTNFLQEAAAKLGATDQKINVGSLVDEALKSYAESLNGGAQATKRTAAQQEAFNKTLDEARRGMAEGARIVYNQQRLVDTLMPGIRETFQIAPQAAQVGADARDNMAYSQGELAFGRAIKQSLQQAYRQAEAELQLQLKKELGKTPEGSKRTASIESDLANMRKLQEALAGQKESSFLDIFDKQAGLRAARERVLDPYVQYGGAVGEIRAMTGLQQQFGIDYDPLRAGYDAALRFRQTLATNPSRIINDLVKTTFQRFAMSGVSPELMQSSAEQLQANLADMGADRAVVDLAGVQAGIRGQDRGKIARQYNATYEQLMSQLTLSQQGLENILAMPGAQKDKEAASQLLTAITKLGGEFSNYKLTDDKNLSVIQRLIKSFTELDRATRELSEQSIRNYVAAMQRQYEAQRGVMRVQAEGERAVAGQQSDNEITLLRAQARGALPAAMLRLQLEAQRKLTETSRGASEATFAKREEELLAQLKDRNQDEKSLAQAAEALKTLRVERENARARLTQQDDLAQRKLRETAEATQLQRQTEQLNALLDGALFQPMRSVLMNYRNFDRKNLEQFVESMGASVQQALINQFTERLQFAMGSPIVDAFRKGGLFSKQYILEGFREAAQEARAAAAATAGATTPGSQPTVPSAGTSDAAMLRESYRAKQVGSGVHGAVGLSAVLGAGGAAAALTTPDGNLRLSDGRVMSAGFLEHVKSVRAAAKTDWEKQTVLSRALETYKDSPFVTTLPELSTMATMDPSRTSGEALSADLASAFGNTYDYAPGGAVKPSRWWNKQYSFGKGKWGQTGDAAATLAGSLGGAAIGNAVSKYKGNNFAQEGASLGSMLGSMTPLGPVGGVIGGVLGGLAGGLFGKKQEDKTQTEALQKIERNTREAVKAFENQTALLQLDSRFLNVPTGFTVPEYRPFGVGRMGGSAGLTMTNNFDINVSGATGADAEAIAQQVSSAIQRQLGTLGNSFDVRNM